MPVTALRFPTATGMTGDQWLYPECMFVSNNIRASVVNDNYVQGYTDFGFDSDAIADIDAVTGIECRLEGRIGVAGAVMNLHGQLIVEGVLAGNSQNFGNFTTTRDSTKIIGSGGGNMWGVSGITGAQVRANDFGVHLNSFVLSGWNNFLGDSVSILVYYTVVTPPVDIPLDSAILVSTGKVITLLGGEIDVNAKRLTIVDEENRLTEVESENRIATPKRTN